MNKKINPTFIFSIIAGIIVIIVFCLYGPRVQTTVDQKIEQKQEQIRLDGILEQINNLYIANEDITAQRNELEAQQQKLHGAAEENRQQIKELWNEYYKNNDTGNIMKAICDKAPNSPMCNNYEMLEKLKQIAGDRGVDYKLLLGIMYAESHIGSNFNAEKCRASNNWAGLKARKYDDGKTSEWFDKQENRVEGCWLYNFETVYDFFESLANTIGIGYKKCNNDIYCISRSYVGHESGSRVNNVYKFYSL